MKKKPTPIRRKDAKKRVPQCTQQQLLMIDAFFTNGFVKKQAMLSAGYSEKTSNIPQLIFGKPHVAAEIDRRRKKIAKRNELSEDWVVKRLMRRADAGAILAPFKKVDFNGQLYWDFSDATEEELQLVQAIGVEFVTEGRGEAAITVQKVRVQEPDAMAALNALCRHLGLFNDKLEIKGSLADKIREGRARVNRDNNEDEEVSRDTNTIH